MQHLLRFTFWLFLIACFFPFTRVLGIGTTTQPNALLLSVFPLLFIAGFRKAPIPIWMYTFVLFFALLIFLSSEISFFEVRDLFHYFSILLIAWASYKFLLWSDGIPYKIFRNVVFIWLGVGLIQFFVYPSFLSFTVTEMRSNQLMGRGITGLATEPTHYATIMGLFLVIYLLNGFYKKGWFLGFLLIFQIIVLARSATVVGVLALSFCILLVINLFFLSLRRLLSILMLFALLVVVGTGVRYALRDARIFRLMDVSLSSPKRLIEYDFSVNERVRHAVLPIVSLFDNKLLPGKFGTFNEYSDQVKSEGRY